MTVSLFPAPLGPQDGYGIQLRLIRHKGKFAGGFLKNTFLTKREMIIRSLPPYLSCLGPLAHEVVKLEPAAAILGARQRIYGHFEAGKTES